MQYWSWLNGLRSAFVDALFVVAADGRGGSLADLGFNTNVG